MSTIVSDNIHTFENRKAFRHRIIISLLSRNFKTSKQMNKMALLKSVKYYTVTICFWECFQILNVLVTELSHYKQKVYNLQWHIYNLAHKSYWVRSFSKEIILFAADFHFYSVVAFSYASSLSFYFQLIYTFENLAIIWTCLLFLISPFFFIKSYILLLAANQCKSKTWIEEWWDTKLYHKILNCYVEIRNWKG